MDNKGKSKLEAMVMWLRRKITNTKWIDKKINRKLDEVQEENRRLMMIIESRQMKLAGDFVTNVLFISFLEHLMGRTEYLMWGSINSCICNSKNILLVLIIIQCHLGIYY